MGKRVTISSAQELVNLLNESFKTEDEFEVYSDADVVIFAKESEGNKIKISMIKYGYTKTVHDRSILYIPPDVLIKLSGINSFIDSNSIDFIIHFPIIIKSKKFKSGGWSVYIEMLKE